MRKQLFQALARINKAVLPSLTRKGVDPAKLKKWQLALLGWKYWVTTQALGD